jgi:hypothetical protein
MLSDKDKKGYALIALVAVVLLGILAYSRISASKPKPAADNCIGEPVANTVILLDHSESVADQTRDEIIARAMAHIREKVQVNERVSIFSISDLSRKSLKPLVSLCRPPDEGNRLTESVKLVQKKFQENFDKPVRKALASTLSGAKQSPIAQAITDVSLSQYLRGQRNSLLIFSDMLEHTERFSLYRCTSSKAVVNIYKESVKGAQERPTFKNTMVSLSLVPRAGQSRETLKCRDALWTWFFGDNEGSEAGLDLTYLPGGA